MVQKTVGNMLNRMVIKSWTAGSIFLTCLMSCNSDVDATYKHEAKTKTPLEFALDSAEIMFLSPESEKIVHRIYRHALAEKDTSIKIRAFRIFTTVSISQPVQRAEQLDFAVSYALEAQKLALRKGDSIEWALCSVQLFRYKLLRREWFKNDEKIGAKRDLQKALHQLERDGMKDALCVGYRTMAQVLAHDKEAVGDVLKYDLLSLQVNDSTKYPALRARICNDIAFQYLTYFRQQTLAERFFVRAAELFRRTNDYLNHSSTLITIALNSTSNQKMFHYCRLAAEVARIGKLPERESNSYFQMALKFQSTGMYDSALFYQRKSAETLPKTLLGYNDEIEYREASMARSYIAMGKTHTGANLAKKYARLIGAGNATHGIQFSVELVNLASAYEALKDFRNLSSTQNQLLALRDSLFSRDRMIEVGRVESRYELELKNKELKVLQMASELHTAETERELWVRFLLLSTAVIATFGLLIVFKLLTQQNQLNESMGKQNATIEQQKRDLEISLGELQKAQAHVLTSEKMAMLGQFTAGVAHELNNPLNFISGGVSVLEEATRKVGDGTTPEERQILHNIRNGVDRAIAIVNSLKVFSNPRSEIGVDSYADLTECIKASLLVLQSKIKKEGVTVTTDFSACTVIGHSGQLCQVFINLIDNAVHAMRDMPKGKKNIEIRLQRLPGEAFVYVHDSGVGIPESVQSNLFRAFYTTKPTGQGIGLGLFICETILRGIGGSIAVTSKVGEGTTFTVQFMCPK